MSKSPWYEVVVMFLLGGLISVKGSAKYLKDSVESENTLAYTLSGKYTTKSEILPTNIQLDDVNVCKLKEVTHVVTEITYGMDAFFAFKKTVKSSSSKERIEVNYPYFRI